jgi:hypothetical protein
MLEQQRSGLSQLANLTARESDEVPCLTDRFPFQSLPLRGSEPPLNRIGRITCIDRGPDESRQLLTKQLTCQIIRIHRNP